MTPIPRSLVSRLLVLLLISVGACFTPAWASEPKKPAVVEEDVKKFKYANEAGETGRSGYVYKRALKTIEGEPQAKPWEPAAEPVVAPKDEKAKGDGKDKSKASSDKKVDKKDDSKGEPKKEEKKKDDKKAGDTKSKPKEKPPEPITSAVYDANVIKLDPTNRPFTKAVQTNAYADYFLCRKTITDKYRDMVLDEMNTFADRMDLPRAQDTPCMVKVAKANTKLPGAIYIEFYVDETAAKACIKNAECGSTRVMMLYPKDKTGKKSQEVYRSYVLTDENKYRRASFCVSPQGQLLGEKSCYVAVNPDWLFN
jgi:hypothetical protein